MLLKVSFTVETMSIVNENCVLLGTSVCFSVLILYAYSFGKVSLEKRTCLNK